MKQDQINMSIVYSLVRLRDERENILCNRVLQAIKNEQQELYHKKIVKRKFLWSIERTNQDQEKGQLTAVCSEG